MENFNSANLDLKQIKDLIKSSIRGIRTNYKGRLAEETAINYLESKGYLVDRASDLRSKLRMDDWSLLDEKTALRKLNKPDPPKKFGSDGWNPISYWVHAHEWTKESDRLLSLGVDWNTYKEKMMHVIKKIREQRKKLVSIWGKENVKLINNTILGSLNYQTDLLALKDDKLYIVEVKSSKTGKMYWHGDQKERFNDIYFKHGIPTMLLSVPVNIDVDISIGSPQIEEIKENK